MLQEIFYTVATSYGNGCVENQHILHVSAVNFTGFCRKGYRNFFLKKVAEDRFELGSYRTGSANATVTPSHHP